jgi:hypothetical protein
MRQLHQSGKKKEEWERLKTAVLAFSRAPPEKNARALKELGESAHGSLRARASRAKGFSRKAAPESSKRRWTRVSFVQPRI